MKERLLEIKDLTVEFPTRRGIIRAVHSVTLQLNPSERLGLVGESGSGKSMTLLTAMRLTPHPGRITRGDLLYKGNSLLLLDPKKMRSLRGKEIAMIFQDPMTTLNPVHKVGRQIQESLRVHNIYDSAGGFGRESLRRKAERQRVYQLMAEVGIPSPEERYEAYPHEFSGGMQQRGMIAVALACNPEVLLADEPTTALDVTVQAQIMNLLARINRERGTGILLVTHDLSLAGEFCDRIAVMYAGQIVEKGTVADVIDRPGHPYTEGLLGALPRLSRGRQPLKPIPGEIDQAHLPEGCAFSPRCRLATDRCRATAPELVEITPGHEVRCLTPLETR